MLVKNTNCPTILTREGDRIRSNGKFGGLMNRAPPIEKLRGAIFGAPVPDTFNQMSSTIDTLQNLKAAMVAHSTAQEELNEQMETINAPEMQTKYEECREVEKQLRKLEKKLGVSTSQRADINPRRTSDRPDEGPTSKHPRLSPAVSAAGDVNLNGNENSLTNINNLNSPTRQSRRIASMTPTTDNDGRKRLKKS